MYTGSKICTLDAKNRFKLPADFRAKIDTQKKFIIINSFESTEKCLYMYPINDWKRFEEKLAALPQNRNTRAFRTYILGNLVEVEMDSAARILIPQEKLIFLRLNNEKSLRIFGDLEKFQIWNQTEYKNVYENRDFISSIDSDDVLKQIQF